MAIKKQLFLSFFLILLLLISSFIILAYASTVTMVVFTRATSYPFQRKTFIDSYDGYYWAFYRPSDEIDWAYSSDNDNWNVLNETYFPYYRYMLSVNGSGYYAQWTTVGAPTNWESVVSDDGDTSYVKSKTKGQIDTYSLTDISEDGLYWLRIFYIAKINATGRFGISSYIRVGNVDYEWAGSLGNWTTEYGKFSAIWVVNPATKKCWTKTEINSVQVGQIYIMGTGTTGNEIRVTQVYATVGLYIRGVTDFSLDFDGLYIHLAYISTNGYIYYRRGIINHSTHLISWIESYLTVSGLHLDYCHKGRSSTSVLDNKIYTNIANSTLMQVKFWNQTFVATKCLVGDQAGTSNMEWVQYPDQKVDIKDVAYVAKYFGSLSITVDNVMANVYASDTVIDIRDVSVTAQNFGYFWVAYNPYSINMTGIKVKFNSLSYNVTVDSDGFCSVPSNATSYQIYRTVNSQTTFPMAFCKFYSETSNPIGGGGLINWIAISSNGSSYPVITFNKYDSFGCYLYVIKSDYNNGTWHTASGFPSKLTSDSVYFSNLVIPIKLSNGYNYFIYSKKDYKLYGKLYTNNFGSEEVLGSLILYNPKYCSAVNVTDNVHVAFLENVTYDIHHVWRNYTTSTWSSVNTVQLNTTYRSAPVLSSGSNFLVCFWAGSPTAHYIYYKKYAGTWDMSPTDWIDERLGGLTSNDRLTCCYQAYNNKIGLEYMISTSSPYPIRYAVLTVSVSQSYVQTLNEIIHCYDTCTKHTTIVKSEIVRVYDIITKHPILIRNEIIIINDIETNHITVTKSEQIEILEKSVSYEIGFKYAFPREIIAVGFIAFICLILFEEERKRKHE